VLENDFTTGGSFTDAATYSVVVYEPTVAGDFASGIYGKYLGWIENFENDSSQETAEIQIGTPKVKVAIAKIREQIAYNLDVKNVVSEGILENLMQYVSGHGLQTAQTSRGIASDIITLPEMSLQLVTALPDGRTEVVWHPRVQGTIASQTDGNGEAYKTVQVRAEVLQDLLADSSESGFGLHILKDA